MKTVCEHCGTVAAEGELFCRACGAMLPVRDLNGGGVLTGCSDSGSAPHGCVYNEGTFTLEDGVSIEGNADDVASALVSDAARSVCERLPQAGTNLCR